MELKTKIPFVKANIAVIFVSDFFAWYAIRRANAIFCVAHVLTIYTILLNHCIAYLTRLLRSANTCHSPANGSADNPLRHPIALPACNFKHVAVLCVDGDGAASNRHERIRQSSPYSDAMIHGWRQPRFKALASAFDGTTSLLAAGGPSGSALP